MGMKPHVDGIHHVTAMAGAPQRNIDFYTRTLGLRLVKRTVNFDDPGTYHFYYGDETGQPGTLLTFFPWGADALQGRIGTGQVTATGFSIPAGSMGYWIERLSSRDVSFDGPSERFDETAISFPDLDGVVIELVETAVDERPGWSNGDIPDEHAVRGFHQATLSLEGFERTAELIVDLLGFKRTGEMDNRFRFAAGGTMLDLLCQPGRGRGSMGTGVVHHIAFRAASDEVQARLRSTLQENGYDVTPVLDRQYFRSVYFREPGGVLFEIATDAPGFVIDEDVAELGMHLKLPPWLEQYRDRIERHVAPITPPKSNNPKVR